MADSQQASQGFRGASCARVGLLGNPSDGYGGRVLALTVPELRVEASIQGASDWSIEDPILIPATIEALRSRRPDLVEQPASIKFTTSIPRQVGLSGSSAIIIAVLRALAHRCDQAWDPVELARIALEVETEVLGWTAGPQDRVVQAYQGFLDMDFAIPWDSSAYVALDDGLLPPLFVAWNKSMGTRSDVAHADVRERWEAGDPVVRSVMTEFRGLATQGRQSLDAGDAAQRWPALLDRAFELRDRIWNVSSVDRKLVETGQANSAGVAFAGSGGAVAGCASDPAQLETLAAAYAAIGAGFLVLAR